VSTAAAASAASRTSSAPAEVDHVTMAVEEYVMRGDFPPENNGRYPWGEEMLAMPRVRV
jgi:hypothetical protein